MAARPVLVTDFDGTLGRGTSHDRVVDALHKDGHLTHPAYPEVVALRDAWHKRQAVFEEYVHLMVKRTHDGMLSDIESETFRTVAERVAAEYANHVHVFTRELILTAKELGYLVLAISGSPAEVVAPLCRHWGIDDWLATEIPRRENGRFLASGYDNEDQPVANKGAALVRLLRKHGYSSTKDAPWIVATGDTRSDISMLRLASYPVAFNPNKPLLEEAIKRHWLIVNELRGNVFVEQWDRDLDRMVHVKLAEALPPSLARVLAPRLVKSGLFICP